VGLALVFDLSATVHGGRGKFQRFWRSLKTRDLRGLIETSWKSQLLLMAYCMVRCALGFYYGREPKAKVPQLRSVEVDELSLIAYLWVGA